MRPSMISREAWVPFEVIMIDGLWGIPAEVLNGIEELLEVREANE